MHLVRLGGRVVSLDHLVEVVDAEEEPGPPPGGARVTLERGKSFHVDRETKALLDRHLEQVLIPDPAERPLPSTARPVALDPETGDTLPGVHERHERS